MLRKVVVAASGLTLLAGAAMAAQAVNIMVDDAYPPYVSAIDGKAQGIYVDIVNAAAKNMPEYTITFDAKPWKRDLAVVEDGSEIGLMPPYKRPDARPWIDRYSEYLLEEKNSVFCAQAVADKMKGKKYPDDFAGLKFTNNAGFTNPGEAFFAMVKDKKITLEEAATTEANLLKVLGGRADCYVNDRLAALYELGRLRNAKNPVAMGAELVEAQVISNEPSYIGYGKAGLTKFPWRNAFADALDKQIKALRESGEIEKIVNAALSAK